MFIIESPYEITSGFEFNPDVSESWRKLFNQVSVRYSGDIVYETATVFCKKTNTSPLFGTIFLQPYSDSDIVLLTEEKSISVSKHICFSDVEDFTNWMMRVIQKLRLYQSLEMI